MMIEIRTTRGGPQTVMLAGQRFVIVAESEYLRLRAAAEGGEVVLPARDEYGNYPAAEALQVSIARSIVRSRRTNGLTQAELARRAGIRPETLNRIEQGKHAPSIATLERLDRALRSAEKSTRKATRR